MPHGIPTTWAQINQVVFEWYHPIPTARGEKESKGRDDLDG
jgi:hypothetical protein